MILERVTSRLPSVAGAFIALLGFLFIVVIGAAVAIVPAGFLVRFAIPFVGISFLVFAWGFRSDLNAESKIFLPAALVVAIAASVLWPRYLFIHKFGLPGVNPFTLSVMGALAFCFLQFVAIPNVSRKIGEAFRQGGWASSLFVVWIGWRFFASILGDEPVYSVFELVKEMVYVGSFFVFGLFVSSVKNGPLNTVRVFVVCGFVVSLIGVFEAFSQKNPFVGFIQDMGDVTAPRALLAIAAEKAREGMFRAQSTFDHPIVFAQFVAALMPLAIFVAFNDRSRVLRGIGFVAIPVAMLAIVKSGSRSGYVSVFSAFFIIGFLWWLKSIIHGRYSKAVAIMVLPALIFAALVSWYYLGEVVAGRNQHEVSSTNVRLVMLKYGISALWESPIWGFGHGLSVAKAGVVNPLGIATIDNYLLSIAVDYGYFGLFLFVLAVGAYSYKAVRFAVHDQSRESAFVGACVASVAALFATFAGLSIYQNMTMFWLLVCISFPIWSGRRLDSTHEGKSA